jgi:hypothetical protein
VGLRRCQRVETPPLSKVASAVVSTHDEPSPRPRLGPVVIRAVWMKCVHAHPDVLESSFLSRPLCGPYWLNRVSAMRLPHKRNPIHGGRWKTWRFAKCRGSVIPHGGSRQYESDESVGSRHIVAEW